MSLTEAKSKIIGNNRFNVTLNTFNWFCFHYYDKNECKVSIEMRVQDSNSAIKFLNHFLKL